MISNIDSSVNNIFEYFDIINSICKFLLDKEKISILSISKKLHSSKEWLLYNEEIYIQWFSRKTGLS